MPSLALSCALGSFTIRLSAEQAPATCHYFQTLLANGGLEGLRFFRVLDENNQPEDEINPIQIVQVASRKELAAARHPVIHEDTNSTGLTHRKWTVSAARFDLGELYGSFFICMRDEPQLDWGGARQPDGQGFAAFGQVTSGFETVRNVFARAEPQEYLQSKIAIHRVSLEEDS